MKKFRAKALVDFFYPLPLNMDVQCLYITKIFLGIYTDLRYERILVKFSPDTAVGR